MTMRAWRVHELGDCADVLRLEDVEAPAPGDHDVVVAVEACGLNFADTLLCHGSYQDQPPLPFTPGLEVAGTVVAAGPAAMHPIGTRVTGSPRLPHGGLAERAVADSGDVFPIPSTMSAVDAAAMHTTYQTGWFALHRRARLRAGETVLVHAGAGGVGSAAIQIAVSAGATVMATAGGPTKVQTCLDLGADHAVDYRTEDFAEAVNDLTDGAGADVVYDSVGGDTFTRSTSCIAWEGRIVVIGAAAGTYAAARTNHAMVKNYEIVGCNWGSYRRRRPDLVHEAHAELVRLYLEGSVRPMVSEVLPLEALPDALDRLAGRATTGKVVLTP
jgi:NADPH2:quinone reductase